MGWLREIPEALSRELGALTFRGPRGALAGRTVLAVVLATLAALALHTGNPWWAAISAFVVSQPDLKASLLRGIIRILGSTLGAMLGLVLVGQLAYDPVPLSLAMFALAWASLLGGIVAHYNLAWLYGGITATMVIFGSLQQPEAALGIAFYRAFEVAIGSAASMLVALSWPTPEAAPAPAPPATSSLGTDGLETWLGEHWPAVLHATRGGLTVVMLPIIAGWLEIQDLNQMAVSIVAVMMVPAAAVGESDDHSLILRGLHRVAGCTAGVVFGLAALALIGDSFLLWLLVISVGIWVCSEIQSGSTGIGYAGLQGAMALIVTLIQGDRPPESLVPALERFAGMTGGLALLMLVTLLLPWAHERPQGAA